MPEIMKTCPNCNNELGRENWDYYDREDDTWYNTDESWSCKCPHCKKIIWIKLPYYLDEEGIEFEIEEEGD